MSMRLIAPFSVVPPASDSAWRTVVSLCWMPIGAGVLHLAEHVDALGARDEDLVAVAQLDVLREHARLEVADAGAEDLRPGLAVGRGPCRPRRAHDRHLARGARRVEPARASASMSVIPPVSGTGPGWRTSPLTNTRWLRYCSTATVTCGLRK
jgi:hypothetical protein